MGSERRKSADITSPISRRRLQDALEHEGFGYHVGTDGNLTISMGVGTVSVGIDEGQSVLLSLQGFWEGDVKKDRFDVAVRLCNAWNSQKIWPRGFVFPSAKAGIFHIGCDVTVPFGFDGATDGQLCESIQIIAGAMALFLSHIDMSLG